jgi:GPH family glycoside/pentoside/hexuronide:cation symporter
MVLYGTLAVILLMLCFVSTRERVTPPPQQNANLKSDLRDLFGSKPWIVLVGVLLLTLAAFAVKGSVSTYYFKYFVKREDLLGWFLLSNGFAFIVAVSMTSYLAKRIGKKPLFMLALGVGGLVIVLFSLAKPADIWFMFALQIASSFIIGFNSPLVWAMFADTADHAEWRTGQRNTGLVFASAIFATKIGFAFGAWILGLILTYFGYVANVEQTGRSIHGIILSMSWIPGLMLVLAAAAMAAYPLSDTLMTKIEADLKERRGEIEL